MINSYDIWHAGLGHMNSTYVVQRLGLINMHDNQTKKCDVCVESNLTKLLNLIHSNLVDLK